MRPKRSTDSRTPRRNCRARWIAITLLLATISAGAQVRECTLVACSSGLGLTIRTAPTQGPSLELPPGHYRLDVVYDRQKTHCEFDIAAVRGSFEYSYCRRPDGGAHVELTMRHSVGYLSIGQVTPFDVLVVVSRDGQEIAREQFFPVYQSHYPNGPDCDPEPCLNAEATMIIPPPPYPD